MTSFPWVAQQLSFWRGLSVIPTRPRHRCPEHPPGALPALASQNASPSLLTSTSLALHANNEDALSVIVSHYCHQDASLQYSLDCNLDNGQNMPSPALHQRAQSVYM